MNLLFWGLTIGALGKVLVIFSVLYAHTKLAHEHRVDRTVINSFRMEFILTIIGLLMILTGYLLEVYFYDTNGLLRCVGEECEQL